MILDNLNTYAVTANQAVSNAKKAYERKEWFASFVKENRLTDFLEVIEQAINSLPEGTVTVDTFSATTGKTGQKKVNQRDISKRSFSTAWASVEKSLTDSKYQGKELKWKLSRPELVNRTTKEKTLAEKLATILDKSIDNKGLETIVTTIEQEQARHTSEIAAMAATLKADRLRTDLLQEIAGYMLKGRTEEQAYSIAALANDIDLAQLKQAIG